jgi:hypothetical protein
MARELLLPDGPIGVAVYAILWQEGVGSVYNGSGFESPTAGNWPSYARGMSENPGTGWYYGDMPGGLGRGTYSYAVKRQLGNSPAPTDSSLGQGSIEWSGTGTVSIATQLDTNIASRMVAFTPPNIDSSGRVVLQPTGLDQVMVAGKTLTQAIRYIATICAGTVQGAGSGLEVFSDFSGVQAVRVFVDSSGNRTNVVLN